MLPAVTAQTMCCKASVSHAYHELLHVLILFCCLLPVLSVLQLPLGTLVYMLNRFQPDDFSREGIPFDVLQELKEESNAVGAGDGSTAPMLVVESECTYYSPTDDMAMEKVRDTDSVQFGCWGGQSSHF